MSGTAVRGQTQMYLRASYSRHYRRIVPELLVGMANVVCQVGIAQQAVADALLLPDIDENVAAFASTLAERRPAILNQLPDYPCVSPDGGWSLLINTGSIGIAPAEASKRLFERGKVAATPMNGWGPSGDQYLRLVFSNEPVNRLADLAERFGRALK